MKTCLVVDDSKVIRKVARHILETLNFEVSEAGAQMLGEIAAELAYGEGLQAHARSAEYRLQRPTSE